MSGNESTAPPQTVDWESLYRQAIDERDAAWKRMDEAINDRVAALLRCEQAIDALRPTANMDCHGYNSLVRIRNDARAALLSLGEQ